MKIFSPKNLAIFHVFGDFLLRSRLNYLMFFEIHRILLTPEGDLRNFAQSPQPRLTKKPKLRGSLSGVSKIR